MSKNFTPRCDTSVSCGIDRRYRGAALGRTSAVYAVWQDPVTGRLCDGYFQCPSTHPEPGWLGRELRKLGLNPRDEEQCLVA